MAKNHSIKSKGRTLLLLLLFAGFTSCETTFDEPDYSSGSANFSSYVAIGSSYTAGFADGALYADGQLSSYPALVANVFSKVGGGVMNQPLLTGSDGELGVNVVSVTGPNMIATTSRLALAIASNCQGEAGLNPQFVAAPNPNNTSITNSIKANGPFNNMGIPGVKSFDLSSEGLGDPLMLSSGANPFYVRVASVQGTSTVIDDALLASPSFFSMWVGMTDVLNYAVSGGAGQINGMQQNDLTPIADFDNNIDILVNKLTANGAKGIIANIPDVSGFPFFSTIPYNGLTLSAAEATALTAAYAGTGISFSEGANAFVIADPAATFGFRKIKENEFILLSVPQDSLLCGGWGSSSPIPGSYVLDETEAMNVRNYTNSFNTKLRSVATAKNLAFADMKVFFESAEMGFVFNGVDYSMDFVEGGLFSLDGLHPGKRGYALVANEFIKAINNTYNSTLPLIDANNIPGIIFP